jgi:hypothetical protein
LRDRHMDAEAEFLTGPFAQGVGHCLADDRVVAEGDDVFFGDGAEGGTEALDVAGEESRFGRGCGGSSGLVEAVDRGGRRRAWRLCDRSRRRRTMWGRGCVVGGLGEIEEEGFVVGEDGGLADDGERKRVGDAGDAGGAVGQPGEAEGRGGEGGGG